MKLTLNGIKEHEAWENAGIQLPGYDVEKISAKAKEAPVMGTFWNRQYFPCIYRWYCRRTSGRRNSGQRNYLCGDL